MLSFPKVSTTPKYLLPIPKPSIFLPSSLCLHYLHISVILPYLSPTQLSYSPSASLLNPQTITLEKQGIPNHFWTPKLLSHLPSFFSKLYQVFHQTLIFPSISNSYFISCSPWASHPLFIIPIFWMVLSFFAPFLVSLVSTYLLINLCLWQSPSLPQIVLRETYCLNA